MCRACTLPWAAPHGMMQRIEVVLIAAGRKQEIKASVACEARFASTCKWTLGGSSSPMRLLPSRRNTRRLDVTDVTQNF